MKIDLCFQFSAARLRASPQLNTWRALYSVLMHMRQSGQNGGQGEVPLPVYFDPLERNHVVSTESLSTALCAPKWS